MGGRGTHVSPAGSLGKALPGRAAGNWAESAFPAAEAVDPGLARFGLNPFRTYLPASGDYA